VLRSRFNISRIAIRFAIVTAAVWLIIIVAGGFAFASLKYTLLPDFSIPLIVVDATIGGDTDARTTEARLTIPLERVLAPAGSTLMRSTTKPGRTSIALSFDVGGTLEARRAGVDALLAHGPIPAGASIKATSIDINAVPVATYAESSDDEVKLLVDAGILFRDAVPAFKAVSGVLRADLIGADKSTAVRLNGQRAIMIRIVKKGGANTLDVAAAVDIVAARVRTLLGVPIEIAATQAPYIREASHATTDALGIAMALSVLVVFPFLRDVRATFISAIAIPVSLAGTAIAMALFHFNLETITLLALTLVTGVIVDDAIVDVENIERHIQSGESPRVAAEKGTDEIGLTVTAATLTIVAVFLPIAFMTGTLGQFFRPFGLTASVAVLTSLAVARTLSPMLAAYLLKPAGRKAAIRTAPRLYSSALSWSLQHRALIVAGAIVSFLIGLAIIPLIPKGFIPHLDRGQFQVTIRLNNAGPTPVHDAIAAAETIDAVIRRDPDVSTVLAAVGDRGDPAVATLAVTLRHDRSAPTIVVENRVRAVLPALANATTSVEDVPFVENGVTKPLRITVSDPQLGVLQRASDQLARRFASQKGFVDVSAGGLEFAHGIPTLITREDAKRVVYVDADLVGVNIGDATARVDAIARAILPKTARYVFAGEAGDTITTFGSFGVTLGLSTLSIIGVLGLLFRGWRAPLVIVVALPLSVVGALFALFVVRADFGLISLMGVIFLFGLVNKNAILLVDAIVQRRRAGIERATAILEAASRRFRPIIMTTFATILGMLPIAVGFGAGSELRAPMAIAIIGGLISSTVLSLLVIPVAYTFVDRNQ
jgi:multidrug efflux pump subunit AcrB